MNSLKRVGMMDSEPIFEYVVSHLHHKTLKIEVLGIFG